MKQSFNTKGSRKHGNVCNEKFRLLFFWPFWKIQLNMTDMILRTIYKLSLVTLSLWANPSPKRIETLKSKTARLLWLLFGWVLRTIHIIFTKPTNSTSWWFVYFFLLNLLCFLNVYSPRISPSVTSKLVVYIASAENIPLKQHVFLTEKFSLSKQESIDYGRALAAEWVLFWFLLYFSLEKLHSRGFAKQAGLPSWSWEAI